MSLLLPSERRPAPSTLQVYGNFIFLRNKYCLLNDACEVFSASHCRVTWFPPTLPSRFGGIVSTVLFLVCFLGVGRFDGCEETIFGMVMHVLRLTSTWFDE